MARSQRSPLPNRPLWQWTALSVIAVAAVGLVTAALTTSNRSVSSAGSSHYTLSTPDEGTEVYAAWLGDSYTEGGFARPAERFTSLTSKHFGWSVRALGQGGTGYVAKGPEEFPQRGPFPDRVRSIIDAENEVVIVAGGLNDSSSGASSEEIRAAVEATLRPLRDELPNSEIYVVGPFWPDGFPNADVLAVRDTISAVATELGLPFIDPINEGWITGSRDGTIPGNNAVYIADDGTHPNVAGHTYLADRLIASLTAAGADPVSAATDDGSPTQAK